MQFPLAGRVKTPWTLRLRIAVHVWFVTIIMMIPVGIAILFAMLMFMQMFYGVAVGSGAPMAVAVVCGALAGGGAGLVARLSRAFVRTTSGDQLRAEPAALACALTVAALLVIAKQGLLPDGAASVAAVFVVLPLAMAAAAAHLRWPDSAMTVSFVTGAAATVATGSLTF